MKIDANIPKFDRVLIFKSGYAILEKTIVLQAKETELTIDKPSFAVSGSLWFEPKSKKVKIDSIERVNSHVEKVEVNCASWYDLLKSNIDKLVVVSKKEEIAKGTIKEVTPNFVFLHIDEKTEKCIKISSVVEVDGILKKTFNQEKEIKKIRINYSKIKKDEEISMKYMIKDLAWFPFYQLICEKKVGYLDLSANILNDAESFFAYEVILTSGSPNIEFSGVAEPLFSNESVNNYFSSMSGGGRLRKPIRNRMRGERALSCCYDPTMEMLSQSSGGSDAPIPAPANTKDVPQKGDDSKEFHTYVLKDITSRKNSRCCVPILTKVKVEFDNVYECEIVGQNKDMIEVNRGIRLKNVTKSPWSTGPIWISSGERMFLGQSKIPFTSKNTFSKIKLMKCFSILVRFKQDMKFRKVGNRKHEELEVKCDVSIRNLQNKDLVVLVKHSFDGSLKKSSEKKFKEKKSQDNYWAVNFKSTLEWEVPLKKKEAKILTFTYTKWSSR